MTDRRVALYFAWSRPAEVAAPLDVIENRFPALFESRRMLYPHLVEFSDPNRFDQGIGGFLDHVQKSNFVAFQEHMAAETGHAVLELERIQDDGRKTSLADGWIETIDTLIIVSFDSQGTSQHADAAELKAVRAFMAKAGNLLAICPHHDIGASKEDSAALRHQRQVVEFLHHGDRTIPPQQGFGAFGRSLLEGLGVPVENRFGLRPAVEPDGSPAAIETEVQLDRLRLLEGVTALNLHAHLPHFERVSGGLDGFDVLARQRIDTSAPPHPFTDSGRSTFDALLQSRADAFAGDLLVGDATLWSSTAGGIENLRRLWTNIARRK